MDLRLIPGAAVVWLAAWWVTRPLPPGQYRTLIWVAGLGLLLCCLLLLGCRNRPGGGVSLAAHLALGLAGVLALTISYGSYASRAEQVYGSLKTSHEVTGWVITEPRPMPFGNQSRWILKEQITKVQVEVIGPAVPYHAQVKVSGKLKETAPEVKAVAQIVSSEVQVLQSPRPWWRETNKLRQSLLEVTAGLTPQGAGLVPGMAIGDTSRVPTSLNNAVKATGLAHLTAVSGGHFAVILMAIGFLTAQLRLGRIPRVLVFAVIATGFVMLVRPEAAVTRAAAMCAISVVAATRGRRAFSIPALAASIIALLAVDPWLARSYGFALSCSASGSLALFTNPVAQRLTPWFGTKVARIVAVPLVAQVGCTPILLLFSDGIGTLCVLANLLVAPAVAPATLLSLAATIFAFGMPQVARWLAWAASLATAWIAWVAQRLVSLPISVIKCASGVTSALLLTAMLVVGGAIVWRWRPQGWPQHWREFVSDQRKLIVRRFQTGKRRYQLGIPNRQDRRLLATGTVMAFGLLFTLSTSATRVIINRTSALPTNWQIAACNVGQGDATVIRTGSHSGILIDTGTDDGAASRCLKELRITTVDLLVLSHQHSDHVGGLAAILASQKVNQVIMPGGCGGEAATVIAELTSTNVPYQVVAPELSGASADTQWLALSPAPPATTAEFCPNSASPAAEDPDLNNHSLVFLAKTGTERNIIDIVLLGDLEVSGQTALLADFSTGKFARCQSGELVNFCKPGGSDIVKVAHHGSAKQAPELARYLNPSAAIFSVGADNTYGHPAAKTLDLYQGVGAYNVRTDQCGTAVFAKQNGNLQLTCLGS